jgi:hypothetical protein
VFIRFDFHIENLPWLFMFLHWVLLFMDGIATRHDLYYVDAV